MFCNKIYLDTILRFQNSTKCFNMDCSTRYFQAFVARWFCCHCSFYGRWPLGQLRFSNRKVYWFRSKSQFIGADWKVSGVLPPLQAHRSTVTNGRSHSHSTLWAMMLPLIETLIEARTVCHTHTHFIENFNLEWNLDWIGSEGLFRVL